MEMLHKSVNDFTAALASRASVPGGGSASALAGALAAALGGMVGELTVGKKKYAAVEPILRELLDEAEKRGLLATNEEIAEMVENTRPAYETPDGKKQMDEYFEAAGLTADEYFAQIEQQVHSHLNALESLKRMDLNPAVAPKKPYDFETEADESRAPADVAREIGQSVDRIVGQTPQPADPAATRVMEPITDADLQSARFSDLKFGKNYDPHTAG